MLRGTMNVRKLRTQDMGSTVFSLSQNHSDDGEEVHVTQAGTSAAAAPMSMQHFTWDGFYTAENSAAQSDSSFPVMYPSPNSTTSDTTSLLQAGDSPSSQTSASRAPKRRRENRYRNASPAVLSRRREQNRASQRAYRERKEQRIRDLEILLDEAHQKQDNLSQAYLNLQAEHEKLRSERHHLPQSTAVVQSPPMAMEFAHARDYTFDVPVSSVDMMGNIYFPPPHPHHEQHLPNFPPPSR